MISQYLWILGSLVFLLLGIAHLRITFLGKKLYPKDESVELGMRNTHPRLTKDTTLWKTWVGFNASHSAGAIFFGSINIILASQYFWVLQESVLLLVITMVFVVFFLFLARKYWFKIPLIGVFVAAISFILSILLM